MAVPVFGEAAVGLPTAPQTQGECKQLRATPPTVQRVTHNRLWCKFRRGQSSSAITLDVELVMWRRYIRNRIAMLLPGAFASTARHGVATADRSRGEHGLTDQPLQAAPEWPRGSGERHRLSQYAGARRLRGPGGGAHLQHPVMRGRRLGSTTGARRPARRMGQRAEAAREPELAGRSGVERAEGVNAPCGGRP